MTAVMTAPEVSSRTALIAEEVAKIDDFYNYNYDARRVSNTMNVTSFVERAYDQHIDLITKWGGWRSTHEPFRSDHLSTDDVANIAVQAGLYIPQPVIYTSKLWTGQSKEIVWFPGYPVSHKVTIRTGQSVSRKILAEVRKHRPADIKKYEKFFEKLGHAWASQRAQVVQLSCAPSDFLWLGEYGEGTCYGTEGEHEHSKFNLARLKNSIVLLLHRNEAPPTDWDPALRDKILGRMWGVMTPSGVLLNNRYRFEWVTAKEAITAAFEKEYGAPLFDEKPRDYEVLDNFSTYAYIDSTEQILSLPGEEKKVTAEVNKAILQFKGNEVTFLSDDGDDGDYDYDNGY